MLVTIERARKIISDRYPGLKFRITKSATVGVRPAYETAIGMQTLVWQRLYNNLEGYARIGILKPNLQIDWAIRI